jgi:hypothetical protein
MINLQSLFNKTLFSVLSLAFAASSHLLWAQDAEREIPSEDKIDLPLVQTIEGAKSIFSALEGSVGSEYLSENGKPLSEMILSEPKLQLAQIVGCHITSMDFHDASRTIHQTQKIPNSNAHLEVGAKVRGRYLLSLKYTCPDKENLKHTMYVYRDRLPYNGDGDDETIYIDMVMPLGGNKK